MVIGRHECTHVRTNACVRTHACAHMCARTHVRTQAASTHAHAGTPTHRHTQTQGHKHSHARALTSMRVYMLAISARRGCECWRCLLSRLFQTDCPQACLHRHTHTHTHTLVEYRWSLLVTDGLFFFFVRMASFAPIVPARRYVTESFTLGDGFGMYLLQ